MKDIVTLISGRGPSMGATVHAYQAEGQPGCIVAVISNRPEVAGFRFAASHGTATAVINRKVFPDRDSFDAALAQVVDGFSPDLVVLAGFMRIFTADFITRYAGRMLNTYPSLLPYFPGLHTHGVTLVVGVRVYDTTVHFAIAGLDRGPIVLQVIIDVRRSDTSNSLAGRLLAQGHAIYPCAVHWFMKEWLSTEDGVMRASPDESQLVIGVNAREAA